MKRVGKYALHQNPFIFRGEKEAERRVYISTRVSQAEKYGGVFVKVEEGHFPSPISFFSAGREHDPLLYGYTLLCNLLSLQSRSLFASTRHPIPRLFFLLLSKLTKGEV